MTSFKLCADRCDGVGLFGPLQAMVSPCQEEINLMSRLDWLKQGGTYKETNSDPGLLVAKARHIYIYIYIYVCVSANVPWAPCRDNMFVEGQRDYAQRLCLPNSMHKV